MSELKDRLLQQLETDYSEDAETVLKYMKLLKS